MPQDTLDIHVNDVGTTFRVPTFDADLTPVNFDPSDADTKQLIFKLGNAAIVTRDAGVAQVDIDGTLTWCLTYQVVLADLAAGLQNVAAALKIQGRIAYADGRTWRSSWATVDYKNRTLKVAPNLA